MGAWGYDWNANDRALDTVTEVLYEIAEKTQHDGIKFLEGMLDPNAMMDTLTIYAKMATAINEGEMDETAEMLIGQLMIDVHEGMDITEGWTNPEQAYIVKMSELVDLAEARAISVSQTDFDNDEHIEQVEQEFLEFKEKFDPRTTKETSEE